MKILEKIFGRLRKNNNESNNSILSQTNLGNVNQFDDVWIKDGDSIYEGWVVKKEDGVFFIVYTDNNKKLQDILFKIERPLNRTIIESNNKVLYLNKNDV